MSVYKYRLSATPEQLEAIGMVATEWQRLESIMDAAIWGLADLPENKGRAITTHINIRTRLSILETLFSLTHEASTSLKLLSGFCKHIDKLSGERTVLSIRSGLQASTDHL